MMKRFLIVALSLMATSSFAGLTYNFQSATTGMRNSTMSGTVSVEGGSVRMDVTTGDNLLFKDNSIVLSGNSGKALTVVDPSSKTYYELQLDDLLGGPNSLLKDFGGMIKLSFDNPRVAVRDAGEGESIEGYPTRKSVLDASYDISVDAMGQKMVTHMTMSTESWTTDQLSGEFTNFMQMKSFHTGFEGLDKLIDAQSDAIRGRFPLKQVTTMHILQGNTDMTSTTTSTVSAIQRKAIAASQFALPSGYTKVDDPISRMAKQMQVKQ